MLRNIIWKGIYYQSIEHCVVKEVGKCIEAKSRIIGSDMGMIFNVAYCIRTNANWETQSFKISSQIDNYNSIFEGERNKEGVWSINGINRDEFSNCFDIDLSLTPFTNTLPINRLKMNTGDAARVDVLYINVLRQKLLLVQQDYSHVSETVYKYENLTREFKAMIDIDSLGLVVHYPGMFERMILNTSS